MGIKDQSTDVYRRAKDKAEKGGGKIDDWVGYFEHFMPPNYETIYRGNAARLITFTTIEGTNVVFDLARLGWHLPPRVAQYLMDKNRIHFVWSQTDALMLNDAIIEAYLEQRNALLGVNIVDVQQLVGAVAGQLLVDHYDFEVPSRPGLKRVYKALLNLSGEAPHQQGHGQVLSHHVHGPALQRHPRPHSPARTRRGPHPQSDLGLLPTGRPSLARPPAARQSPPGHVGPGLRPNWPSLSDQSIHHGRQIYVPD